MINLENIKVYVDSHYDEAVNLLETLGRIPAPSRQEDLRAIFCRDWFQSQGAEKSWIDNAKNAICSIGADDSSDLVVFMAHTDIVFNDTEELPMHREGDILHAPGIGDDTSNLVNLMMASKYLLTEKPSLNMGILIIANACEEGLGNLDGCKEIISTYGNRIKAFYSFDGYLSQCTSIPVGSHRFRITAHAEGGHSYLDFGKDNAIVILTDLIQSLSHVVPPTIDKTTYNIGYIQGGSTINSLPEECYCLYEYRSPSQECLELMSKELQKIVKNWQGNGYKIDLELLGIRPGKGQFPHGVLESYTNHNIEQIRTHFHGELDLQPYSTDSNVPLSIGIPANTIGTIEGGKAHTREEWINLNSLRTGMSIILSIMGDYIKQ